MFGHGTDHEYHDFRVVAHPEPFALSIWSDWPTNALKPFSTPSNLLWTCLFDTGDYRATPIISVNPGEWFYDPAGGAAIPFADTLIWQYTFPVDGSVSCVPFTQQVGNIYWLTIEKLILPDPGLTNLFGWKTTDPTQTPHFNDDAVWAPGGISPIWFELRYFPGHPYDAQSIDLAFIIDGDTNAITPPNGPPVNDVRDLKWQQPLDTLFGICVSNLNDDMSNEHILDDFVSDGRPINGVRWWGCYPGYMPGTPGPVPPPGPPDQPPTFWLDWYSDVPAGVDTNYSHPGTFLEGFCYAFGLHPMTENYYTSTLVPGKGYVHHFEYNAEFPTNVTWNEKEGVVYWFSAQAEYFGESNTYGWAWSTTSAENHWNDDAVRNVPGSPPWQELYFDEVCPGHPYGHSSLDLAFELYSDVRCRRAKKWLQPPDMFTGENMWSYMLRDEIGSPYAKRADDFLCDGRRITDVHWWGSYLNWETNYSGFGPPRPPIGVAALLGFNLSFHYDVPANPTQPFSMPSNPAIAEIFVPFERCHEVFFGTVTQFWKGTVQEHEYQYYVDLLDPALGAAAGAWLTESNTIYWLDVQGVFSNAWTPGLGHLGWGWKTTDPQYWWNDVSVVNTDSVSWMPGDFPPAPPFAPGVPVIPHPLFGAPMDLAFELTTDVPATNPWYVTPRFVEIDFDETDGTVRLDSLGDLGAGIQVLQCTTNLNTNIIQWTSVTTNWLPWPAPWTNTWWTTRKDGTNNTYWRILNCTKPPPGP